MKENSETPEANINLLEKTTLQKIKPQAFRISKFFIYLFIVMAVAMLIFSSRALWTGSSITDIFTEKISFFKQLNYLVSDDDHLSGENDNRVNVLLLGIGGAGHEGPYLTDTLILASFQPSTGRVALLSVPRDLYVNIPEYGWSKINNANAFGQNKNPGHGGELALRTVAENFGLPLDYYVTVDFAGFEKIIDDVDGLKINVERSFVDYQYPTADFKYQVVSFEAGWQTMDGDTALKYARSRHGNNGEGSDFARSRRQQQILAAFKERVFSLNFFLSPRKINKVLDTLADHLRTNLEPWEMLRLAQMMENVKSEDIKTFALDDSPNGLLYADNIDGAFVLRPRGGDFSLISQLAQNVFNNTEISAPRVVNLEIRNGTATNGLASRHMAELKNAGFRVTQIGNAPTQDYNQTKLYKLTADALAEETVFLTKTYGVNADSHIPDWIKNSAAPDLDFFLILGQDQAAAE